MKKLYNLEAHTFAADSSRAVVSNSVIRGALIIYCNCHRNSHAMYEIPMKYNTGNSSIFYLSMDTSIVPIGALVFVLLALEVRSFI